MPGRQDVVLRSIATPFTVCPLSNVRLGVVPALLDHPLKEMLRAGLLATVNSDDPAYFGGYVGDNYGRVAAALRLTNAEIAQLARNSFEASFIDDASKRHHLASIDAVVEGAAYQARWSFTARVK